MTDTLDIRASATEQQVEGIPKDQSKTQVILADYNARPHNLETELLQVRANRITTPPLRAA